MCHACLLKAIYLLFLTVFLFFISAHVDDHISVLRPGCRLYEKGLSSKTNKSSVKNELSVQCKIISTRSLRKFIQNRSARRADDYSIESKRSYFDLKTIPFFSWKSHREQDCPCAKKAKWRPSNQAKNQPAAEAGESEFTEILSVQLFKWVISFAIQVEISNENEVKMLFHRSLPSPRCLLGILP